MAYVYILELEPSEVKALEFVLTRYQWPTELWRNLDDERSAIVLTEADAWNWVSDCESDEEGGHSPFPCASQPLVNKLTVFRESIV